MKNLGEYHSTTDNAAFDTPRVKIGRLLTPKVRLNFLQKYSKNQSLKKLYRPIVDFIIDRLLLPKSCQKERNERGYDILNEFDAK